MEYNGIKIATPISTLFQSNDDTEDIVRLSDTLEIRDPGRTYKTSLSCLFHCELSLIKKWSDKELEEVAAVIKSRSVPLASFHALSCYAEPEIRAGKFYPAGEKMSRDEMMQNAASNLEKLRILAGDADFALENNNYFPTGAYETVTEPVFLNQIINATGINLLLDIGHAEISAHNQKIPFMDLVRSFDLLKVKQIHLSGISRSAEGYADAHQELSDSDWQTFRQILILCPNTKFVTIEYYKHAARLIEMLKRLKAILV